MLIGNSMIIIKLFRKERRTSCWECTNFYLPLPAGCGREKPGIWYKDPELAWFGLSSRYPHVVRDPTNNSKFLRACCDSVQVSNSNLHTKVEYTFIILFKSLEDMNDDSCVDKTKNHQNLYANRQTTVLNILVKFEQ